MARAKKQEEEIKTDGWKDTFSDLMNLLLCFFVLLFSMSNVDEVKYAELVASLSNSFSIFNGGAQAIGEGVLVSSGATQLNNLDEYYSDMGKASESDVENDPLAEFVEELEKQQKNQTEELYNEIVEQTEQKRLEDSVDVTIDDSYQYVMVSLSGDLLFESGSAEIPDGAKKILSRVGDILKNYPGKLVKIEGHTDNVPISNDRYENNDLLSAYRAFAVKNYILGKTTLEAGRINATGCGEYSPVADNSTQEGRARNRRVEIKIYNSYNSN